MKKAVITAVALTLVACMAIGGTLAYLMQKTDPVTNTFTVGDINIELKEHNLQENGQLGSNEVTSNNTYKVVPGTSQPKDPFVRVKANSEECYVYICIEDQFKKSNGTSVVTYDIDPAKWHCFFTYMGDSSTKLVYRYIGTVDGTVKMSNEDQKLPVFTTVTYSSDILKTNIQELAGKKIILTAFAHQYANVSQAAADQAALKQFGLI